jgi:hypothetical protein
MKILFLIPLFLLLSACNLYNEENVAVAEVMYQNGNDIEAFKLCHFLFLSWMSDI